MNEVKRGAPPAMLFQKPANPLIERVEDFLEPRNKADIRENTALSKLVYDFISGFIGKTRTVRPR